MQILCRPNVTPWIDGTTQFCRRPLDPHAAAPRRCLLTKTVEAQSPDPFVSRLLGGMRAPGELAGAGAGK